jgi:hypothetical protein
MKETILLGKGEEIVEIPRQLWEGHVADAPAHAKQTLSFMTADHHRVRYFAVDQLVRTGANLEPESIASSLDLPLDRTHSILDDLEKHLFFLVRNERGAVAWAFPVTVEQTPHRISFNSGETLYGA